MRELTFKRIYQIPSDGGAGSAGGPGNGTVIVPGDFGDWTALPEKSVHILEEQLPLKFRLEMQNYPDKAALLFAGQFSVSSDFTGTELVLGVLPPDTRPGYQLREYFICRNIECQLTIGTDGVVKMEGLTGNLPTSSANGEPEPYFINVFYNPQIGPAVYTASRTANFTRNNCGAGQAGSSVPFTKVYTSNVSQADANNLRSADVNFNADGQAYANDPANGATCTAVPTYSASRTGSFTRNNCPAGYAGSIALFTKNYVSTVSQADADAKATEDPAFASDGQAYANDPSHGTCELIPSYTATRTAEFARNNCPGGYTGSIVPFTKSYVSTVSQADADAKAAADPAFASDGQAFANDPSHGTCTVTPLFTAVRTADFTRNNCGTGYAGSTVSFSKTYSSNISQADANIKATTDLEFEDEGQAYANDPANGSCAVLANIGIEFTAPGMQGGATNLYGYKITSSVALSADLVAEVKFTYENTAGNGLTETTAILTLPAGTTDWAVDGYPLVSSPANSILNYEIISSTPADGSDVETFDGTPAKIRFL